MADLAYPSWDNNLHQHEKHVSLYSKLNLMDFQPLPIPDPLKGYVKSFWKLENNAASKQELTTMADGSPGLIFQHPSQGDLFQNGKKLAPLFLYGQATSYATLHSDGNFNTFGIFFDPRALKLVFGLDASELTDTCIDLSLISEAKNERLLQKLLNAESEQETIETIASFVMGQLVKNQQKGDGSMEFALSHIISSRGTASLEELTQKLRLSERSLERKFKEQVGISPKLFSRICRFQASLRQLTEQKHDKLSDIAFENDYADQSHFIRSFKEFAGASPLQFQKQPVPFPKSAT